MSFVFLHEYYFIYFSYTNIILISTFVKYDALSLKFPWRQLENTELFCFKSSYSSDSTCAALFIVGVAVDTSR